jgi:hypothetical protein
VIFGDDEPGAIDLLGEDQGEDMDFQPVGPDPWDVPEQRPTLRNPVTRFSGELYPSFGPAPIIGDDIEGPWDSAHPALLIGAEGDAPALAPPPALPVPGASPHSMFDLESIEHAMGAAVRAALAHELVADAAMLLIAGESDEDYGAGDALRSDSRGIEA